MALSFYEDFEWGNDGDDITDSGGPVTWTKSVQGGTSSATISTVQSRSGTRSMRLYHDGTNYVLARTAYTAGTGYEIRYRFRVDANNELRFIHGNGSKRITCGASVETGLRYWYTTWIVVTGVTVVADTWYVVEFKNINWTAGTYDIWWEGALVESGANLHVNAGYGNELVWSLWDLGRGEGDVFIDDIGDEPLQEYVRNLDTNIGLASTLKIPLARLLISEMGLASTLNLGIPLARLLISEMGLTSTLKRTLGIQRLQISFLGFPVINLVVKPSVALFSTSIGLALTFARGISRTSSASMGLASTLKRTLDIQRLQILQEGLASTTPSFFRWLGYKTLRFVRSVYKLTFPWH